MPGCAEALQAAVDWKSKGFTMSRHTGDRLESAAPARRVDRQKNSCAVMPAACKVSGDAMKGQQACPGMAFGDLQPMGGASGTQRELPMRWWTSKGQVPCHHFQKYSDCPLWPRPNLLSSPGDGCMQTYLKGSSGMHSCDSGIGGSLGLKQMQQASCHADCT